MQNAKDLNLGAEERIIYRNGFGMAIFYIVLVLGFGGLLLFKWNATDAVGKQIFGAAISVFLLLAIYYCINAKNEFVYYALGCVYRKRGENIFLTYEEVANITYVKRFRVMPVGTSFFKFSIVEVPIMHLVDGTTRKLEMERTFHLDEALGKHFTITN